MIRYIHGNIFESDAQVLVNPVNTVGVMGKGLALEFKKRYPDMFRQYQDKCRQNLFHPGSLMFFHEKDHDVLLFPTKEHWKDPSMLAYVKFGLSEFRRRYEEYDIQSVAFPMLGCGNGGLSWDEVRPVMERYLQDLPIDIQIYLPEEKREEKRSMVYAVDFDNTLAVTEFPKIIAPKPEMIEFVKMVRKNGDRVILWTTREGKNLEDALSWCREQGIEFDAVNEPLPEQKLLWKNNPRKIFADYYIDGRNMSIGQAEKIVRERKERA